MYSSNTSSSFFTVALPYTSLLIVNTGAKPHAPTHLVASIENLPSGVVCPSSILSLSFNLSNKACEPLTKQAVPRHTDILYFPFGSNVKRE